MVTKKVEIEFLDAYDRAKGFTYDSHETMYKQWNRGWKKRKCDQIPNLKITVTKQESSQKNLEGEIATGAGESYNKVKYNEMTKKDEIYPIKDEFEVAGEVGVAAALLRLIQESGFLEEENIKNISPKKYTICGESILDNIDEVMRKLESYDYIFTKEPSKDKDGFLGYKVRVRVYEKKESMINKVNEWVVNSDPR